VKNCIINSNNPKTIHHEFKKGNKTLVNHCIGAVDYKTYSKGLHST
jgi:hypothetical protein